MISVMLGSASSASSGPNPRTSSRTESTSRSLSALVIVIAVVRKYSSASSRIFSRTPLLLLESIWSANFSMSLAWICTFAAVKAGPISPPGAAAARVDRLGAGAGVSTGAEGRATLIAVAAAYGGPPGAVATGPLVVGAAGTGTPVWFCLTLSRRPMSATARAHAESDATGARPGRGNLATPDPHKAEKPYLRSTCLQLHTCAFLMVWHAGSAVVGGCFK